LNDRVPIAMGLVSFLIAIFAPRKWPSLGMLVIVLAYFLIFFAFFLPITRYRVPLLPVYAIFAGGLPEIAKRLIKEARSRRTAHLAA
jgi:nitrate/nitrite transporter NarK